MSKKQILFATLFPNCPNFGLVKDVGQIPYVLGKENNDIGTQLVTAKFDEKGPYVDKVSGLEIVKCKSIFNNDTLSGIFYLLKNSKEIDWLNLYHCGRRSYLWARIYKCLNKKGKVYLKLDLDFRSCDLFDSNKKEREAFTKITSIMDLVSVESRAVYDRVIPYAKCDIRIIRNGYSEIEGLIDVSKQREDTFITVGRLGTKQKATDIMLEAFAKSSDKHSWNLRLVGPIEPEFEQVIKKFYSEHPDLVDRVVFVGNIEDRKKLYQEYCNAKVFVLPSRWESFGIVGPEALSCGCRVILSDQVPPMYEVTNAGKYGKIVETDNVNALSEALIEATKETYLAETSVEMATYAHEMFSWEKVCEELYRYLKEL